MKKLLVSVIGCLIVDTGVQAFVVVVVKIVSDAGLRVGQVGKNGPLAYFEHLRFEAGPAAFGLRTVVAIALPGTTAPALRAHGCVVVQQFSVSIAAVLPDVVRMHQ